MSASRSRGGSIAEINVTPMADVMIVLLIIFMVATPIIRGNGVQLPVATNARDASDEPPVVVVRSDGSVFVGKESVDRARLLSTMIARLEGLSEDRREVVVHADGALGFDSVQEVLSACREAGAHQVSLATRRRAGDTH